MTSIIIFGALAGLGAVLVVGVYNSLIFLRNQLKNAFAQIDVQLKRRYDLIPNLVESAKGYLSHEKSTLEAVIKARQTAVQAVREVADNPTNKQAFSALTSAESMLNQSLGRLIALVESYPDLKANEQVTKVMEELVSTENKVAFSRQAFNDAVMEYNINREKFPNSVIAQFFQFREATPYAIENKEEQQAPKVSFH